MSNTITTSTDAGFDDGAPAVLPDGVDAAGFEEFIARLRDALGDDRVLTDPLALIEFRDPYTYRESDQFDASAVVSPITTEQVQAVVRLAAEYVVPLWTFGQGRNNTYGGPAPRVRGSVIVNLRDMNRVLEVDEELAYAVVEPGVRWFDLHDELEARGGALWSSIPDLGWGSVVGNSLDYGVGYSPNGDHGSQLCGMEVVLANGEVLRTGMGAFPESSTWHLYPHSFGPTVEGLFKQSNFGIVTKVGVWLIPRPERYSACWALFSGIERLGPVIDVMRSLMQQDVVTNLPMFLRGLEVDADGVASLVPGSEGWSARFALYGAPTMVDAAWSVVERAFDGLDGVQLIRKDFEGTDHDGPADHDQRVQRGIPDMDLLDPDLLPYGVHTAHLDLSPIDTARGSDAVALQQRIAGLYAQHGLFSVGGVLLHKRYALHISTTFYDPRDEEQTAGVFDSYAQMVDELADHGYVPYRTNLQNMDRVADKFSFGDGAQLRFVEALKDAIDPKGILAPGKSGIWPQRLRIGR